METISQLRQRAERYRLLRRQVTDPAAARAISEVTEELDMTAEALERRHHIRERANDIWMERGQPEGHDVEIWLAAEREVDIRRRR
jgi:hypothetical protein